MTDLILKGIVTGFILSVMIGPVFFILLETSIKKGVRAGLAFDFGVFLSDVIYVLIAFLFYNEVKNLAEGQSKEIAKTIGGVVFIVYGVITFFKTPSPMQVNESKEREPANWREYIFLSLKGFLLNLANPLVIFYWFSVLSLGDSRHVEGLSSTFTIFIFISLVLLTFFSIDILKIFGAKQLRPFITPKLLKGLNMLIAIVFVVFGVFLIVQGLIEKV